MSHFPDSAILPAMSEHNTYDPTLPPLPPQQYQPTEVDLVAPPIPTLPRGREEERGAGVLADLIILRACRRYLRLSGYLPKLALISPHLYRWKRLHTIAMPIPAFGFPLTETEKEPSWEEYLREQDERMRFTVYILPMREESVYPYLKSWNLLPEQQVVCLNGYDLLHRPGWLTSQLARYEYLYPADYLFRMQPLEERWYHFHDVEFEELHRVLLTSARTSPQVERYLEHLVKESPP